jgi:hypothetical protein
MTAALPLFAGSVTAPGLVFGVNTGTGLYQVATNSIGYSAQGTQSWYVGTAATNVYSTTIVANATLQATTELAYSTSDLCFTQCYFQYTNATTCTLLPRDGNLLWINGTHGVIPSAGVTLSNSGLTTTTFYYVYAHLSGSTIVLDASTTTYATNSTYGIKQKSADPTRTLVGAVYIDASGNFQDLVGARYVISYFNRRKKSSCLFSAASPQITTTGTSNMLEFTTSLRNNFIFWSSDSSVELIVNASGLVVSTAASSYEIQCGVDAVALTTTPTVQFQLNTNPIKVAQTVTAQGNNTSASNEFSAMAENASHFLTLLGSGPASSNTLTINGATSYTQIVFWG